MLQPDKLISCMYVRFLCRIKLTTIQALFSILLFNPSSSSRFHQDASVVLEKICIHSAVPLPLTGFQNI